MPKLENLNATLLVIFKHCVNLILLPSTGCSVFQETPRLARATHQLEALNHWHKKSERKKKVVNDPLPFPFFFLFLRLPTSTNVTLNHAKLDNNTVSVSLKKSRNLRCCVRYFFKLSFTPILAPKKLFFPFLFNGWMVKKMQKEPKDTSTVYLSLPLKVMHRTF